MPAITTLEDEMEEEHPAVVYADQCWANWNHAQLCDCHSWPTNCVNGYTMGDWLTGATADAVATTLSWAASQLDPHQTNHDGAVRWLRGEYEAVESTIAREVS